MNDSDLNSLLRQLRRSAPEPSGQLVEGILSRLGPPSASLRTALYAGAISCALAVALSAWIGSRSSRELPSAPPEFTLLTPGGAPLASL